MITEHDLREAIAECEGVRNPSAGTCLKLAAFYTILNHMTGGTDTVVAGGYSLSNQTESASLDSDSEFSQVVNTKGIAKCLPVVDELMSVLYVVNQPLYDNTIRKLKSV